MYKREIVKQLNIWRNKTHRKPLVLRGARQVGKTTLVKEFGKDFDAFVYLNLEKGDAEIFRKFSDVRALWQYICLTRQIMQGKDSSILLFIDEIQEEPKAVALLRYFYEELPEIHVIAAGSRLQSLTREGLSFPVGRVEYLTLRPFSFAEYIEAKRGEAWADMVRGLSVPEMLHEDMIAEFNTYALVGGMPEAVAEYLDAGDITRLAPIFNALLKGYNEDAEKFAKNQEQAKILRHILSTAWLSAAETITFGCFGNSSYTATQIHDAMDLLERAYLLSLDYPVTATAVPAMPAKRRAPKLMMVDTGLANFFAGIQVQYLQNKELLDTWRGRAAEHIVAQELRIAADRQYKESLYFWVRDQKGATAEVDFIWQDGIQIIPIEVKAGTNARLRSLHSFVNACERPVVALRVWSGNYSVQEVTTPAPHAKPFRLVNIPFYYIGQIDTLLQGLQGGEKVLTQ